MHAGGSDLPLHPIARGEKVRYSLIEPEHAKDP
jgi:hypothetical protein